MVEMVLEKEAAGHRPELVLLRNRADSYTATASVGCCLFKLCSGILGPSL